MSDNEVKEFVNEVIEEPAREAMVPDIEGAMQVVDTTKALIEQVSDVARQINESTAPVYVGDLSGIVPNTEPMSPEAQKAFDMVEKSVEKVLEHKVFEPVTRDADGDVLVPCGVTSEEIPVPGSVKIESDGTVTLEGNAAIVSELPLVAQGVVSKQDFDRITKIAETDGILIPEPAKSEVLARKEAQDEMAEIEFWLELDETYDKGDEYVVIADDHLKEVDSLSEKIEGLESMNKELTDLNKDGATVIKAFVAYRKWVLSMSQRFGEVMNGAAGWRDKISAGKKFAKELAEAASQFDIGLTTKEETVEDKATKREKQKQMIVRIYDMAVQSLDPENFEAMEKALLVLARTRKIPWEPMVREPKGESVGEYPEWVR